jgi:predicted ester cyclase
MTGEEMAEIAMGALNTRDLDTYFGLAADDVERVNADGTVVRGKAEARRLTEAQLAAFPDATWTLRSAYDCDACIVLETTFEGTQTGAWELANGTVLPPSGRRVSSEQVTVNRMRNGKVFFSRLYADRMEMMQQLGLIPEPAGVAG